MSNNTILTRLRFNFIAFDLQAVAQQGVFFYLCISFDKVLFDILLSYSMAVRIVVSRMLLSQRA